MERGLAESIATIASLLWWLYLVCGLAVTWVAKYYRDDLRPGYRMWSVPSGRDAFFIVGVWILSGTSLAFLGILEQPVVSGFNFIATEFSWRLLFWASFEEVLRAGVYDMFRGSLGLGVLANSVVFGIFHLHNDVEKMINTPLYAAFFPLAGMATSVALLAILVRVGLIWAIVVHFCVNTFRLVLLTSDGVLNYLIFFVSMGLLIYTSLPYLKGYSRRKS
ncbi:MAG: type II CAAX prenyl endopeptidase Rce1 family protein [Meiothermus ruber]|uniref:CPBP family glutamic-type intramembrane protease n=1 Tax=Meiothermus ruber TaxID=277 RepID=UPI00391BD852